MSESESKPAAAPKNKGGRPPKYPDKPWIKQGISRQTFYRRQAKKGGKQ